DADLAFRFRSKSVDLRQAETRSLPNLLRREERLEHMGQNRRFDADPVVAYSHHGVCTGSKVGFRSGSASSITTLIVSMMMRPPFGRASRAFTTRLRIAASNCARSTLLGSSPGSSFRR